MKKTNKHPTAAPPCLNSTEMAKALASSGVELSPSTIRGHYRNAAPRTSASEFVSWLETNAERVARSRKNSPLTNELRETKLKEEIRCLRTRAEREELELGETKRRLVAVDAVRAEMDRCCAKAVAVLTQKFETELPPKQDGMPAEKIAELNRKALDEIYHILGNVDFWRAKP